MKVEFCCQVCQAQPETGVLQCSRCKCGYYCGVECQCADWPEHSKHVCKLWKGDGQLHNPWFAHVSPPTPHVIATIPDDELLDAAKRGDVVTLTACIDRGARLNTTRGSQGETALHFAVTSGNLEAIQLLLQSGAYINVNDWRNNSPFYYACTHPGVDDVLKQDEDKRVAIVRFLQEQGADTMQLGGMSGKRPFQQARVMGRVKTAEAIESSELLGKFTRIRDQANNKNVGPEVKKFVDLTWRAITANWFIMINRSNMGQCTNPQPQMVAVHDGSIDCIEAMFRDCQARHERWWNEIKK